MLCRWCQETRPYSAAIVRATREAAKPELVLYTMALTLASVATVVKKPIYGPYTTGIQKSRA